MIGTALVLIALGCMFMASSKSDSSDRAKYFLGLVAHFAGGMILLRWLVRSLFISG